MCRCTRILVKLTPKFVSPLPHSRVFSLAMKIARVSPLPTFLHFLSPSYLLLLSCRRAHSSLHPSPLQGISLSTPPEAPPAATVSVQNDFLNNGFGAIVTRMNRNSQGAPVAKGITLLQGEALPCYRGGPAWRCSLPLRVLICTCPWRL